MVESVNGKEAIIGTAFGGSPCGMAAGVAATGTVGRSGVDLTKGDVGAAGATGATGVAGMVGVGAAGAAGVSGAIGGEPGLLVPVNGMAAMMRETSAINCSTRFKRTMVSAIGLENFSDGNTVVFVAGSPGPGMASTILRNS